MSDNLYDSLLNEFLIAESQYQEQLDAEAKAQEASMLFWKKVWCVAGVIALVAATAASAYIH